jgi:hypothetical protein
VPVPARHSRRSRLRCLHAGPRWNAGALQSGLDGGRRSAPGRGLASSRMPGAGSEPGHRRRRRTRPRSDRRLDRQRIRRGTLPVRPQTLAAST